MRLLGRCVVDLEFGEICGPEASEVEIAAIATLFFDQESALPGGFVIRHPATQLAPPLITDKMDQCRKQPKRQEEKQQKKGDGFPAPFAFQAGVKLFEGESPLLA